MSHFATFLWIAILSFWNIHIFPHSVMSFSPPPPPPPRLSRVKCAPWSPCEGVSSQGVCNPSFINVLLSRGSGSLLQRQLLKVITQVKTNKAHRRPPFDSMCTVTRPGLTANKGGLTQNPNLPSKGKPFQLQWFLNECYCINTVLVLHPSTLNWAKYKQTSMWWFIALLGRNNTIEPIFLLSIACWGCYFEEDAPKLPISYSLESQNWKALADVTGHGCDFSACDCYSVIKHGANVRRKSYGIRKIMRPLHPRSSCSCQ